MLRGCLGCDRMVVGFRITYMQSVHITSNLVRSNPSHGEVDTMQQYFIKFVSDLQLVSGFLLVLLLKVVLNTILNWIFYLGNSIVIVLT